MPDIEVCTVEEPYIWSVNYNLVIIVLFKTRVHLDHAHHKSILIFRENVNVLVLRYLETLKMIIFEL